MKHRVEELLSNQAELKTQLDPFIEYAKKTYPNININEALSKLQSDIAITKEMAAPVKLLFDKFQFTKENNRYELIIELKTTKPAQLGELEFTVTCDDRSGKTEILGITTEPEIGDYYIMGPYLHNISTNKVQAKLKYKPVGIVKSPNIVVYLNQKSSVTLEGNHGLSSTTIKVE